MCFPNLIRDEHGNCIFKELNEKAEIKIIDDGMLLIKNVVPPKKLANTCGIGNHTIEGSFLISFRNCSVIIKEETFDNIETHKEHFELLPFFNLSIKRRNMQPLIDMHELHNLHIKKRKKLEMIHFNGKEEKKTSYFIVIMVFTVLTIIIVAIAYLLIKIQPWKIMIPTIEKQLTRDEPGIEGEELAHTHRSRSLRVRFISFLHLLNKNKIRKLVWLEHCK